MNKNIKIFFVLFALIIINEIHSQIKDITSPSSITVSPSSTSQLQLNKLNVK